MEVYGTKPKKFTKDWWGYFWYYYKWHTIGFGVALFVIVYTCVDCALQTKYDLQADIITETPVLEQQKEAFTEMMSANITDASGNGQVDTFVLGLSTGGEMDPQAIQAIQTKLMLEPQYSESYIFVLSKKYADMFTEYGCWEKSSTWTDAQPEADGCMVSLAGCSVLEDIGIDTQDLYIAVRTIRDKETDDEYKKAQHENAVKFAQYLISQR